MINNDDFVPCYMEVEEIQSPVFSYLQDAAIFCYSLIPRVVVICTITFKKYGVGEVHLVPGLCAYVWTNATS